MRDKLTEKEREKLRELQAIAKREERHKKQFLKEVEEEKEEVLKYLGVANVSDEHLKELETIARVFSNIAERYGTDLNGLAKYISSDRQVNYYKQMQQRKVNGQS